jgi:dTDP-4-amino-4,6-dideoxygalactose transaminase
MRMLRDWGQSQRYHHALKGFNFRMDAIQGAILRVKLRHLEAWTEARRANARLYASLLANSRRVSAPVEAPGRRHVYHVFAVRCDDRDQLQKELQAAGIHTGLHYPIPVHLQPAHADLGYKAGDFPISEMAARQVLSLPMFPELTAAEISLVVETVEQPAYAD